MTEVQQHDLTELDISKVQFDPKNPNQMTDLQQDGLGLSMKSRTGMWEHPVIQRHELDAKGKIIKRNKNLIANGEHRIKELIKAGNKTVKCVYVDMTEGERIMIRQMGNKMGGQHDRIMDADELRLLEKLGLDKDFQQMLAISESEFQRDIEIAKEIEDVPSQNKRVEFIADANVVHRCIVPDCNHGMESL